MIASPLYEQIVASMPIPGVEAMIVKDDSLLFMKRRNDPARGEWWFPGGRVRKGESFEEALRREVKEETGLGVEIARFVGVYSRVFPERHDITIVFLCRCSVDRVKLDEEHSAYRLFKETPSNIHPYLLKTIQDSGWRM